MKHIYNLEEDHNISHIQINSDQTSIEVKKYDEAQIAYESSADFKGKIVKRLEDGQLIIDIIEEKSFFSAMYDETITFYVPQELFLDKLSLVSTKGDVYVENLEVRECEVHQMVGGTHISLLDQLESLVVYNAVGFISLVDLKNLKHGIIRSKTNGCHFRNLTGTSFKVFNKVGTLKMEDSTFENFLLENVSGSVKIFRSTFDELSISVKAGDVKLEHDEIKRMLCSVKAGNVQMNECKIEEKQLKTALGVIEEI